MMRKIFLTMTVFLCLLNSNNAYSKTLETEEDEKQNVEVCIKSDTVTDSKIKTRRKHYNTSKTKKWSKLIKAIRKIESKGDNNARYHGCYGPLQISETAVKDANEYLKKIKSKKRYNMSDRFNLEKSTEIFNIEQERYNKQHDINKAIRIWNGGPKGNHRKTNDYLKKVLREYDKQ